jgi:AcrR family transcriptional regulator
MSQSLTDSESVSSPSAGRARAARVPAPEARRRIIEATNRLLRERRFRELTVDDVMTEAGLSRTVFYRHFDGMAGIVLGLLGDLLGRVVAEADAGEPDDPEVMRRGLAFAVETFRDYGPLLLAFDEAAHHHDDVERAANELLDRTVAITAGLIERGIEQGHTPPCDAVEVARALTVMNSRYLLETVARDPRFDADRALNALWIVWARTTWPDAER